jgi:hypothetical protein
MTLNPTNPELGQTFTAVSRYADTDGSLNNTYRLSAIMTAPNGSTSGGSNVPYTISGSDLSYTFPPLSDNGGGTYTVRTVLSHPTATWFTPVQCDAVFDIANYPYFKVYGGDLQVGPGFGEGCSKYPSRIVGVNNDTSPFIGSGAQLAALAFNQLMEFATGTVRTSSQPNYLSFARNGTTSSYNTTYGGGLGYGHGHCMEDYFAEYTSGGIDPGDTLNINPASDATYYRAGNLTLTQAALEGIDEGEDVTVYVDGNVFIQDSITYRDTSSYDGPRNIPLFKLVVRGNIYVAPGVTRLDGLYVAQPVVGSTATTGRFYTCGYAFRVPTSAELAGPCKTNRLVIYGAVVAYRMGFFRTPGTLSTATTGEYLTSGGTPSEVFIYSPEMWLESGLSGDDGFDAITPLPPVL